jgi:hypothetical protein
MKRTLFTVLSVVLLAGQAMAQVPVVGKILPKVILGIKAGANMQTLKGDSWDTKYNPGIVAGAFVGLTKGKLGIQVEGLVKSAKFDTKGTTSVSIKTMSLDVPVLLEYKLISRLWIQVGPQFSSMLSAKNGSTDVKTTFKTSNFDGVIGLQAILPLHLTAGARYILGLTDANNGQIPSDTKAWKSNSIQVYVGFRFL